MVVNDLYGTADPNDFMIQNDLYEGSGDMRTAAAGSSHYEDVAESRAGGAAANPHTGGLVFCFYFFVCLLCLLSFLSLIVFVYFCLFVVISLFKCFH